MTSILERIDIRSVADYAFQETALPAAAVAVYFIVLLLLPMYMAPRKPMSLALLYKIWNFVLAIFSIGGAIYCVPVAWNLVATRGFVGTLCQDPHTIFYDNTTRLWVDLFALLKFIALGDSLFVVLQKEPLLASQWVHHSGVLLFCWQAHQIRGGYYIIFVAINSIALSLWRTYHFLAQFPDVRAKVRPFFPVIRVYSLVQLEVAFVGTVVNTVYYTADAIACPAVPSNLLFAFLLSAALLFFFFESAGKLAARIIRKNRDKKTYF